MATKKLLLGNEAVAQGALEANVDAVTTYPGTPASEIGDTLFQVENKKFHFEYSVNEKVALEVGCAFAQSGLRALTAMKHVGLNVASDALMTYAYLGTGNGAHVIIIADDPHCHSSQNEQDSRVLAKFANLPMLEPSNPQEARDMTVEAFRLSEELELPVIIRMTTRICHMRGIVTLGKIKQTARKGHFGKDPMKIAIPAVSRQLHKKLFEKMTRAKEISNKSKYNTVEDFGGNMIIVTSGAGYNYTREAIDDLDLKCTLIKVGMSNPIPDGIIGYEVADFNDAIVIEELEPYLEEGLGRDIGSDHQIVYGKGDYGLERYHEYTQDIVTGALAEIFGLEQPELPEVPAPPKPRPPQFCKGCPHRATYDLIKKHAPDDCIYVSDIGCYTMAHELPYAMADINLCMGASIGLASGFAEATDQSILAFIGDSTFFHAGLPAIVNAAKHDNNFTLVILDNSTTAMTGHQPHAGLDLNIEDVVRALGVTEVITIDPRQPQDQIKEIIEHEGLSVIISKSPCILKVKP